MSESSVLWRPSDGFRERSNLTHFRSWLKEKGLDFVDYDALWEWSVDDVGRFWGLLWEYFDIQADGQYVHVLDGEMPDVRWFEGVNLNYAEHVFAQASDAYPAILWSSETRSVHEISWSELGHRVSCIQQYFQSIGVKAGDRVAAFLPNIPHAIAGFLASASFGAIWSSCSPDFGAESVIDRFSQIEPSVLFCVDGYQYGGKEFDKREVLRQIVGRIPSIKHIVFIPYLDEYAELTDVDNIEIVLWEDVSSGQGKPLGFKRLPFDHPLWVLYSSGTTGVPKAITHGHGGMLMEHLKYLTFHNDVHPGERFFWYTTTGWMMWNFVQAALLKGATIVLYDGSPGYPNLNVLWELAAEAGIQHFGTSAPFLIACMRSKLDPGQTFDLARIRSVSSTGAPLPSEAFDWVYAHVDHHVWLCSMSGGTDVCTAFVGGCPDKPVIRGEIQCRALGCALYAFDEDGKPKVEAVGEMVITEPMPCMPVFFWNDPDKARYRKSYFDQYRGIWRHGDWVKVTDNGGIVITGRSDTTLNRQGVRIGTAEIYRALHSLPAIEDALIVHLDKDGADHMPLFIVLKEKGALTDDLKSEIKQLLRKKCSPRHVPDSIIEIDEVPYTISGKKMEAPVKRILSGEPLDKVASRDAMRNPDAINTFLGMEMP